MTRLYIQLGTNEALSAAELDALLETKLAAPTERVGQPLEFLVTLEVESDDDAVIQEVAEQLQYRAGGIVKIMRERRDLGHVDREDEFTPFQLEDIIADIIIRTTLDADQRITFGVGKLGFEHLATPDPMQVKKTLRKEKRKSRFIEGPAAGLTAAVLLHQDVREFLALYLGDRIAIAETLTVQDIDAWTHRDREKPFAERRRGMLPPKLARIMVNLGLATTNAGSTKSRPYLYDPFCGTGTIALEALLRGCDVANSDVDEKASAGTQRNLDWFLSQHNELQERMASSFAADATHVELSQLDRHVDTIVTEPLLGQLTPDQSDAPNIIDGLERLYLGAFKQWRQLLKPGASIVMVFPVITFADKSYDLSDLIDKLESLDYTFISEPIRYARPDAVVQRDIHRFRYEPTNTAAK